MSSTLGVSSPGGGSGEEVRRSVRIKTKKPKPKRGHSSWPIDVHALCGKTKRKAGKRRSTTAAGDQAGDDDASKPEQEEADERIAAASNVDTSEAAVKSAAESLCQWVAAAAAQQPKLTTTNKVVADDPGKLVRADHDYIELLVDVKEEPEDEGEDQAAEPEEFHSLSTLAEVSMATAGHQIAPGLQEEIFRARQNWKPQQQCTTAAASAIAHQDTPVRLRKVELTVPENTTHIVICTSKDMKNANNNISVDLAKPFPSKEPSPKKTNRQLEKHDYICGECGKKYSTSSNLARHRQTHRSLTDSKAKRCPYCTKIYVSMPAFAMHMRTHNQNCKCEHCGKTFSRPWLLQGHLRTHTGERPYKCDQCNKSFADRSNLRAHVQTHSNAKPFKCSKCDKTFALRSYLCKHEEVVDCQKQQ